MTFAFKIVTPERIVFESDVAQVTLPTEVGEITVLPNHIPLVGVLRPGEIQVQDEKGEGELLAVSGGFIEVTARGVVVLADTAEMAHELEEGRAEEAHARAQKLLESKAGVYDRDYAALKILMDKELVRLKVARKYRERRKH